MFYKVYQYLDAGNRLTIRLLLLLYHHLREPCSYTFFGNSQRGHVSLDFVEYLRHLQIRLAKVQRYWRRGALPIRPE